MNRDNYRVLHSVALVVILAVLNSFSLYYYPVPQITITYSSVSVAACFFISLLLLPSPLPSLLKLQRYQVLTVLLSCYCIAISLILMLRIEYSRSTLLFGFILSFIWITSQRYIVARNKLVSLHSLSNVDVREFNQQRVFKLVPCKITTDIANIHHGIVSNFHKPLSENDKRILANCSLNDIPIYHSELLKERLSKKVSLNEIEPNNLKLFSSNEVYFRLKTMWELGITVLISPVLVLISLIVALTIKMNNPSSPVLFMQNRCGLHGKSFLMYKFRTMIPQVQDGRGEFATNEQHRIDKLGSFLRKTRLDELPQFWNVLKGEMAIIGPRPEQPCFVQQFQRQIPLYGYRHSVKPGITGWAQVEQGYTDSTDSTKDKVAFDLYYIKNISAQLDLYILIKTVNTIFLRKGI